MKRPHGLVPAPALALLLTAVACGSSGSDPIPAPGTSGGTSGATSGGTSGATSGGTSGGTSGATSGGTSGATSGGTSGTSGGTPAPLTIFTIVMENHDYAEIVGKTADAPYINSLIDDYALATNYNDSGVHPSLPNYLTLISGSPQFAGGSDPLPTASGFPKAVDNLGTQLEAAKIPWRSYQEGMGTACNLSNKSNASGNYGPKHDPFLYFTDMQTATPGLCAKNNVDYSEFAADLAAGTYRYMWITPNLTHDGHDPDPSVGGVPAQTLKTSDTWAQTTIDAIMASAVYKANGVIFLTWDEAEGRSGAGSKEQVPMIVISPKLKGAKLKSTTAYSHKSYLATVEDLLKMPRLPTVTGETAMSEFFK